MVIKIISGGQAGVDRAALDFALKNNIDCGGWCPKGRKAENGVIPDKYPLRETNTGRYPERTEKNVLEGDGTLILFCSERDRGTLLTRKLCENHSKAFLEVDLKDNFSELLLEEWLMNNRIEILNIAGPRESFADGIYKMAYEFLDNAARFFTRRSNQPL